MKPVIGLLRTLDDCIRALNNIRAYFNEPDTRGLTTAAVNDSRDRRYVTDTQLAAVVKLLSSGTATVATGSTIAISSTLSDVGGTGKQGQIQIRFMGYNPDGSNMWQLEVV
jgi:hypothetical protein